MDKDNTGRFAWIVSIKQSCNERWARFRNRLRRRFYARRGQTIDPTTIVNETGTGDMVICKTPHRKIKVTPESLAAPRTTDEECPVHVTSVPATGINECFENLVEEYVSCVITKAADTLRMEKQNKNAIVDNSTDKVSMSSSIISQIADMAVTESLSNILLGSNINQCAIHFISRTIKAFMVQMSLELLAEKLMTSNLLSDYDC